MKILKLVLTITIVTFLSACSSDDGTNGTNGIDGQTGATGATGTANVIYSAWILGSTPVDTSIDGTTGVTFSINAPELSQDILDKGTVLVYLKFGSDVFPLPYTSYAGGYPNTISAIASLLKIKIFRFAHVTGKTITLPTSLNWRYILIPGGVAATAKVKKVDYSKMSYEEVCSRLSIQR